MGETSLSRCTYDVSAQDSFDIATLKARYETGALTPTTLVGSVLDRIAERGDDRVWIDQLGRDELVAIAERLEGEGPTGKPLYGIPFAIKDNIDLAGHPTTAACPAFAYQAPHSAYAVERLISAGAIPIGKTNLDQFATGLSGTRSPYGAPSCALRHGYISGGSSSGSGVAVAAGLVSFALGTDTAGSGRVPAAFNNVLGLKPTRGLISTRGVVPACRSLDCVSIFALTSSDALAVLDATGGFDAADPFSRQPPPNLDTPQLDIARSRFGIPCAKDLDFFGNREGERLFWAMLRLIEKRGGTLVEIDFTPFLQTAELLYHGPWIAERYVAIQDFFDQQPGALYPTTRQIIEGGTKPSAAESFKGYYHLKDLQRVVGALWGSVDVLITPTAGRQYSIDEMIADPIHLNNALGYYTNFVNLLDLTAVAVPAGLQPDGLAFGITLLAPAWHELALCKLADVLHRAQDLPLGATAHKIATTPELTKRPSSAKVMQLAVCGAHMSGLPLNHQLSERGGRLVRSCRTAPHYQLFALPGGPPLRPGLIRREPGRAIELEIWEFPIATFGGFLAGIRTPLTIGNVELEDGTQVKGFLCEAHATADARDITEYGGWRPYIARSHTA